MSCIVARALACTLAGRPKELRLSYAAARGRGIGRAAPRPGGGGGRGRGRGKSAKAMLGELCPCSLQQFKQSTALLLG